MWTDEKSVALAMLHWLRGMGTDGLSYQLRVYGGIDYATPERVQGALTWIEGLVNGQTGYSMTITFQDYEEASRLIEKIGEEFTRSVRALQGKEEGVARDA